MNGTLISIPSVIDKESITTDADVIGIVFPVYYVGLAYLPLIVRRFVEKLEDIGPKYVFAVCTYGGGAGRTLELLDELIRFRGGRLSSGFGVQMPQNAFNKPFENREKLCKNWKEKQLARVVKAVAFRQETSLDTDPAPVKTIVALLEGMTNISLFRPLFIRKIYRMAGGQPSNRPFAEVMPLIDNSYHADEKCTGCGICAKVCSVHNIKMVDAKPAWQHRCENCLACINWCPQKAIHGYAELPNLRRYHHPEVKLSDIVTRD